MAARAADALVILVLFFFTMQARALLMEIWPFDIFPGAGRTLQALPIDAHLEMLVLILPSMILGMQLGGTYGDLRGIRTDVLMFRIVRGVAFGTVISLTSLFLFQAIHLLSRTLFIGFVVLSTITLFLSRRAMVALMKSRYARGIDVRNILVIGTGGEALPLIDAIGRNQEWGLKVVGVLHPESSEDDSGISVITGLDVMGRVNDLGKILETHPVDQVYLTGRPWNMRQLRRIADCCEEVGVEFSMDANFLGLTVAQSQLLEFEGNSVLSFSSTPVNAEAMVIKRLMDIVLSGMALAVLAPILALTALAIKIEDPGPVFFGQRRSGLFGRTFTMWKFRSMVADAEKLKAQLQAQNEMDGPVFKMQHDPRITRVGRFIRKFSIDELPQFWNVFVGEMSLVGPRPPIPAEVTQYERWQMRRLSMKPGITCIWQVSGRNNIDFKTWMKLDLQYIDNWSLFLDLKLLLKTPYAVVSGSGK